MTITNKIVYKGVLCNLVMRFAEILCFSFPHRYKAALVITINVMVIVMVMAMVIMLQIPTEVQSCHGMILMPMMVAVMMMIEMA